MGFEEDGVAQTMLRDYLILATSLLTMMKFEKQRTALGFPGLWFLRSGNWKKQQQQKQFCSAKQMY